MGGSWLRTGWLYVGPHARASYCTVLYCIRVEMEDTRRVATFCPALCPASRVRVLRVRTGTDASTRPTSAHTDAAAAGRRRLGPGPPSLPLSRDDPSAPYYSNECAPPPPLFHLFHPFILSSIHRPPPPSSSSSPLTISTLAHRSHRTPLAPASGGAHKIWPLRSNHPQQRQHHRQQDQQATLAFPPSPSLNPTPRHTSPFPNPIGHVYRA